MKYFKIEALTSEDAEDAEEKRKNTDACERAKGIPTRNIRQRFVCYPKILILTFLRVLCVLRGERVLFLSAAKSSALQAKC
jgi:hypothetical protein